MVAANDTAAGTVKLQPPRQREVLWALCPARGAGWGCKAGTVAFCVRGALCWEQCL